MKHCIPVSSVLCPNSIELDTRFKEAQRNLSGRLKVSKTRKESWNFSGFSAPLTFSSWVHWLAGWLAGKRRQISIPFVLLLFNNSVTVGWRAVARLLSTTSCALLHPSWTARHPSRAVEWSECYYLPPWTTCFVVQCPIKIGLVEPLHHKIACTRSWIYSGLCIPFASYSWPVYLHE